MPSSEPAATSHQIHELLVEVGRLNQQVATLGNKIAYLETAVVRDDRPARAVQRRGDGAADGGALGGRRVGGLEGRRRRAAARKERCRCEKRASFVHTKPPR